MPLRNLAERRIRDLGVNRNLSPFALAGVQHFQHGGINGLVHATHYPYTDFPVNPHTDTQSRENRRMAKVRDIVAKNVSARMAAGPLKTQKLLSARAGISQSHVSRIENGASGITIDRLELVAIALGCEPYELLLDDEQARRALIERLMRASAVSDERVEQAGFVPIKSEEGRAAAQSAVDLDRRAQEVDVADERRLTGGRRQYDLSRTRVYREGEQPTAPAKRRSGGKSK